MTLRRITIAIAAAAMLAACGSQKKVAEQTTTSAPSTETPAGQTTSKPQTGQTPRPDGPRQFVSDLDLTVGINSDTYHLGGKISMKRDEVMRLNLTFMGFIEVGIIEFTPEDILIVNRMAKEYTRLRYDDMDALRKNNITFSSIETMAWDKFYAADGKKKSDTAMDKAIEDLINSNMRNGKRVTVKIEIGKPDTSRDFATRTTVKSTYKEVPAQTLMAKLMSLAGR